MDKESVMARPRAAYLQALMAVLDNADSALPSNAPTHLELDRQLWRNLSAAREEFWADLGAPLSTCVVCGRPMTTEHNGMTGQEHDEARLAYRERLKLAHRRHA